MIYMKSDSIGRWICDCGYEAEYHEVDRKGKVYWYCVKCWTKKLGLITKRGEPKNEHSHNG